MVESDRVHIEASLDDRVAYILQVDQNYTNKSEKVPGLSQKLEDDKVLKLEEFHFHICKTTPISALTLRR